MSLFIAIFYSKISKLKHYDNRSKHNTITHLSLITKELERFQSELLKLAKLIDNISKS